MIALSPTAPPDDALVPPASLEAWPRRAALGAAALVLAAYHRAELRGLEHLPFGRPLIFVAKYPRTLWYGETFLLAARLALDGRFAPLRASRHGAPTRQVAVEALRRGESLLLFPGGRRELDAPPDTLRWHGRRGYARLAALTGTPVVPVAIDGADRQHRCRVRVRGRELWLPLLPLPVKLVYRFGTPLDPPASGEPGAVVAYSERVAHAARQLLVAGRPRRRR